MIQIFNEYREIIMLAVLAVLFGAGIPAARELWGEIKRMRGNHFKSARAMRERTRPE